MAEPTSILKGKDMTSTIRNLLCRLLAIALIMAPFQTGQAAMIGTDQALPAASAQAERSALLNLLNRGETRTQLQSLGVDSQAAADRVAAMTDDEVRSLAGNINAVPAGADGTVIVVLVVAALVWWFYFRR
jgi:hypothetical protein